MDEIIDRLMPLVWNVARAQHIDHESASDVVQTVWLTLLQHLDAIRTPAALAAWLVTVTRREARRVGARARRLDLVETDVLAELPDRADDVGSDVAERERNRCLWRHLNALPPRCQELLRIVAFVDRPNYAAVAEALGMPRGSIGPTRGRCLARLRRLLSEDPAWSPR